MKTHKTEQKEISLPAYGAGRIVAAEYHKSEVPSYRRNPFIEALPPIFSDKEIYKSLANYPEFVVESRDQPTHIRLHHLFTLLELIKPDHRHIQLFRSIDIAIRRSYLGRNIVDGSLHKLHSRVERKANRKKSGTGFMVIGISGIGKTTAVGAALSIFPQVVFHSQYMGLEFNFIQLVWLKIDCPYDGRLAALCEGFFAAVDDVIGTNYSQIYRRSNIGEKLLGIKTVVEQHRIGILVIDEIQNLVDARGVERSTLLNYLVSLVNLVGIPVILIGTYKALTLFKGEFRMARRSSGEGAQEWHRIDKGDDWSAFLQAVWKYQYIRKPSPLSDELSNALYEVSQGITDVAIKTFMLAQSRSMQTGMESLTVNLIRSVAKDHLGYLKTALDALKSKDLDKLKTIEDLRPLDVKELIEAVAMDIEIKETITKLPNAPNENLTVVGEANTGEEPSSDDFPKKPRKTKKSASRRTESQLDPSDLRGIFREATRTKKDFVVALRASGVIVPIDRWV
ncbi:MAG: ATP-binding protein [Anaerolineae bacterium]|nr:MAG: ATP-binding protein [Anaerolineae bacterium]